MQKTAQKRSILNKLREMTNVSGIAAEKFFNPQFQAVMENLRIKDDQIRSIVAGAQIGKGDAPQSKPLKDLLKQAKSNLNRREFMAAVADLGRFHEQVKRVVDEINAIDDNVNEVHNQFLFKDLGDEHVEQLQSLKNRFEKKQASLQKEAGLMDFFYNIGTKRGRALAAWEKRYPAETNKFKNGITAVLAKSQNLLETIISSLKEMASARSVRNLDSYVTSAAKIKKSFGVYEDGKSGFKEFYNSVLKPYLAKMEAFNAKPPAETEAPTVEAPAGKEMGKQEVSVESPAATAPAGSSQMLPPPMPTGIGEVPSLPPMAPSQQAQQPVHESEAPFPLVQRKDNTIPAPPPRMTMPVAPMTEEEEHRPTIPSPPPANMATAHKKFYAALESLSNESPILLASYIRKYASTIQGTDPETSINLFKIAKSIRG